MSKVDLGREIDLNHELAFYTRPWELIGKYLNALREAVIAQRDQLAALSGTVVELRKHKQIDTTCSNLFAEETRTKHADLLARVEELEEKADTELSFKPCAHKPPIKSGPDLKFCGCEDCKQDIAAIAAEAVKAEREELRELAKKYSWPGKSLLGWFPAVYLHDLFPDEPQPSIRSTPAPAVEKGGYTRHYSEAVWNHDDQTWHIPEKAFREMLKNASEGGEAALRERIIKAVEGCQTYPPFFSYGQHPVDAVMHKHDVLAAIREAE